MKFYLTLQFNIFNIVDTREILYNIAAEKFRLVNTNEILTLQFIIFCMVYTNKIILNIAVQ